MRVDLLSQVQQVYNVGKPRKTTGTNSISRGTDGVEISSIGRDIQTAKTAVKNSPDVREKQSSRHQEADRFRYIRCIRRELCREACSKI